MLEIKQVGNRFYYFSRMQVRSFPIKKTEALAKIEKGEAYLVERFITDPTILEEVKPVEVVKPIQIVKETIQQPETKSNKVISFADRLQAKQEKESLDDAKNHFLNEVLPNMNIDEMKKLTEVASNSDNFNEELMRITLRISMEKAIKDYNGGIQ